MKHYTEGIVFHVSVSASTGTRCGGETPMLHIPGRGKMRDEMPSAAHRSTGGD